ncbi:MAG: ribonuclease HII [Candidatus Yanofskybacteria bacterium RIFCSPLOWO2_12_FULL_44_13b]|uniref:Ribonuclease n=3 Tax=Patescibacteria group TaxID=1783273 RepID=A0A0G1JK47_9BACT|nr:MAG: Ribonuclease HII [Microgenomates group bacterium GW2011_GWC1_43_11]KKT35789.1 MAG: Ribonuclease HII [Candidatus Gottesmanbacteria bacterium GW2011_GWB1_44_11c]OGN18832.1 MAG: ribonuclease HII [Candidatus Yanofskybacteria bacterium RIFCSPHIGHO2_12_FULL_44_29b]OGN31310.1 MAG: ribonuclease HII [Candidatus Yanofskybacteria bacterium RIFCSPLOWO2_02_FULL_44_18]OGN34676.1 MAG: ribonuclease HII [Candidatus Yanofskybacteria bacterium RIFCSPLOWO2_12_FULL_44_13b]
MKLPNKTLERKLFSQKYGYICAVDEVGMGCLAGPVLVCAVGFTNSFYNRAHKELRRLRESKLLLPKQREKFASELIKEKGLTYKIAYCRPKTIDRVNIYQATRKAMKRAVLMCATAPFAQLRTIVLVDGPRKINDLNMEQMAIVRGDRKVFAIACASIIAKVYRDKMMSRYAKKYPGYGFERHKGYGTKYHQTQLASLGPCEIHRRSFRLEY